MCTEGIRKAGIPFLIECLKAAKDIEDAYFLVVEMVLSIGNEEYASSADQENFKLMKRCLGNYDTWWALVMLV